ncbi:hypothetical protein KDW40_27690, partial [Burkholderia cenocepacia]|nr:hypothetical protein [Burkholderia cenocepacia]
STAAAGGSLLGAGANAAGGTAGAVGSLLTTGANSTATVVNAAGTSVGTVLGSAPGLSVTPHSGNGSANNPLAPVTTLLQSLTGALQR